MSKSDYKLTFRARMRRFFTALFLIIIAVQGILLYRIYLAQGFDGLLTPGKVLKEARAEAIASAAPTSANDSGVEMASPSESVTSEPEPEIETAPAATAEEEADVPPEPDITDGI